MEVVLYIAGMDWCNSLLGLMGDLFLFAVLDSDDSLECLNAACSSMLAVMSQDITMRSLISKS